ncbi:oxygen-insensitive NADPH nitroreductase [Halalkalibacterium ligniniphilum]|uniref:oxygen-insensitive NADPH nitroreductase n=1 Tax=Halalkalibacterium ligniniphilum TaxID=1134413 RepID=UPI000348EA2D|nr:oxygen-insensitive NADPH nitroreductase [Halalkalibacterium ligniniphilum]
MGNKITELIQSHRSIRKFTNEEVANEIIEDITLSGQWAPSSNHIQAYSILVIQDQSKKQKLAELTGNQVYVEECPVFFIICADFHRLHTATKKHQSTFEINEVENVMVGAVDAALVAQNMFLAARSYGLGGVMIGGIRNNPEEVAALLELPKYVIPIMGLCVGYPAQSPQQKPRLPRQAVVHHDRYEKDKLEQLLDQYDEETRRYYMERTNGKRSDSWSELVAKHFSTPKRPHLKGFIKKQGIHLD